MSGSSHIQAAIANAMLEQAEGPVAFLAPDFRLVRANRAYARACGRDPGELPGYHHFELFPHRHDEPLFVTARDTGQPATRHETAIERPDAPGEVSWWDWTLSPACDDALALEGFVLSLRDVTETVLGRKRAEAIAARLRVTLAGIGDAVIVTDLQGRITFMNAVAEGLTGYRSGEAIGLPLDDVFCIVNEHSRNVVEAPVAKVLATGIAAGLANHTVLIARDRSECAIDDSAAPIRDEGGNLLGVVLVFRDITERRRVEEELRRSQQSVLRKLDAIMSPPGQVSNLELADLFDAQAVQGLLHEFHKLVPIPMAVIDLKGKVLVGSGWQDICTRFHRVHPETCKHCIESDTALSAGARPGEARVYKCKNNMWDVATPIMVGGHHLGNVFTGQFFFDDEPVDRAVFLAQARRYGFDEHAYMAALDAVPRLSRRSMDSCIAFLARLAHLVSQSTFHALSLARAVSERTESEQALKSANERLEDADRRKNEFLAMLAHELRNPLAAISNAYHVLERSPLDYSKQMKVRTVVGRQVRNLSRMVDDLLDVARITHGKVALRRERLDLTVCVEQTVAAWRQAVDEARHELVLSLPEGPVWIDADAARVDQVLGNLLSNAIKYTERGGEIDVTLEVQGAQAVVRVRDNGMGIDTSLLPHVFELFTQADTGMARSTGGLGIGLALVRSLVELHGGGVEALSDGVGRGAEFLVRLPLASHEQEEATEGSVPRPLRRQLRVLVVDDNRDSADTLAELLVLSGHDARAVYDGSSAIAEATAWQPELVLLDLGMPGMDGYEVAQRLRATPGQTPARIVALTGYGFEEARERVRAAGFHAHITKPISVGDLESALAGAEASGPGRGEAD